jgi:uncharacterized protein (TIGR02145 family)
MNLLSESNGTKIKLNVTESENGTRVVNNGLNTTLGEGDSVGMIISCGSGSTVVANNFCYVFDGSSWVTNDNISGDYSGYKNFEYIVYYPYSKSMDGITTSSKLISNWTQSVSQFKENDFRKSDLMIYKYTPTRFETSVDATLYHQYASFCLKVKDYRSIKDANGNIVYKEQVDLPAKVYLKAGNTEADRTMFFLNTDSTYRYILPPLSQQKINWFYDVVNGSSTSNSAVVDGTKGGVMYSKTEEKEVGTLTANLITSGAADLGLSVKWASCNLGASSPEEYGDYYAWGETKTKDDYSSDTYNYDDAVRNTMISNDRSIAGTEYDVAHVKLGDGWRLPTKTEIEELISKCKYQNITYKNINGLLIVGTNNNAIFIPAAGERVGKTLYMNDDEHTNNYWSATAQTKFAAWSFEFGYSKVNSTGFFVDTYAEYSYLGFPVRPVTL